MRIKKADLATEKEIIAFFTRLMRDEQAEIALRLKAAEMLCKNLLKNSQEAQESAQSPLYIQVDYGKEGDEIHGQNQ